MAVTNVLRETVHDCKQKDGSVTDSNGIETKQLTAENKICSSVMMSTPATEVNALRDRSWGRPAFKVDVICRL
jgi:hypothetical protein